MKTHRFRLAAAVGVVAVLAVVIVAIAAARGGHGIKEKLTSYQEVPALSTPGQGTFRATIDRKDQEIHYTLKFSGLESPVTQSHIHFENRTNSGPVVVFLCTNLGNGPAGTPTCPANGGTVTGTLTAASVRPVAGQNVSAGDFAAVLRILRSRDGYVNVHTVNFPGGEIRGQVTAAED